METDTLIVSKNIYNGLLKASLKLRALEQNGVDNWEWYGEAMQDYHNHLKDRDLED